MLILTWNVNKHFDKRELTEAKSFSRGLPNNCWRFYSVDIKGFRKCSLAWVSEKSCQKMHQHTFQWPHTGVFFICVTVRKGEKKAKLTNQGIVRGPEHSCLTLVQSRKEARGLEWIKLAGKEEGEESRKDRLCFRCSQVVGQLPETDVISLPLRWWVRRISCFFYVCESRALAYISCPSTHPPVYVIRASADFYFYFIYLFSIFKSWANNEFSWLMIARWVFLSSWFLTYINSGWGVKRFLCLRVYSSAFAEQLHALEKVLWSTYDQAPCDLARIGLMLSSLSAANVCAQSFSLRIWGVEAPENLCLRSSTVSGFPERIFKTKKVVPGSYDF